MVEEPNAYTGLALDERTVLLKIHGDVDRGPEREWESFVVSEDDHIDYLAAVETAGTVPVQLAARLRRSHFLFLGYASTTGACASSSARVGRATASRTARGRCSRSPSALARELWRERGVEALDVGARGVRRRSWRG